MHSLSNSQNNIQGEIHDGFAKKGSGKFLYYQEEYLALKRKSGFLFKQFIATYKDETIARIIFTIEGDTAIIGKGSPFGAILFENDIYFERIEQVFLVFKENLALSGLNKVYWKHYPEIYDFKNGAKVLQALLNTGFLLNNHVLNFHLNVKDSFENNLAPDTKRRLKKCQSEEFSFQAKANFDVAEFYKDLVQWRSIRQVPINMTELDLRNSLKELEGVYTLLQLFKGHECIAFLISVKVSEKVLYTFLPAHNPAYDDFSPMVALTFHAFNFAKELSFDILDLGVASASYKSENYGLIKFKEKVGGKATLKMDLTLNI